VHGLSDRYGMLKCILLVGHEPYLNDLISVLVSGSDGGSVAMKKTGLCKSTVNSAACGCGATLEWLLTPGQMAQTR